MSISKQVAAAAIVCAGTIAAWGLFHLLTRKKRRLPPINKESMLETVHRLTSKQAVDFLHEKMLELGPVYRLNVPETVPVVMVCDPTLSRMIYNKFPEKSYFYCRLRGLTGFVPNVFTKWTHGEGWDWARKSIAKSFSNSNLLHALPLFHQKLEQLQNKLEQASQEKRDIDINYYAIRLTLDFLTNSMFATDFDFLNGGNDEGNQLLNNLQLVLLEYGMRTIANPFRSYMFWDPTVIEAKAAAKALLRSMQTVLEVYRRSHTPEQIAADQSMKSCFGDYLIAVFIGILGFLIKSPYPTDLERTADMLMMVIAGHDTTGYAIAWTIIEVARHRHVYDRIKEEMRRMIPDGVKIVDHNAASSLEYLDWVIKEGLRLRPSSAYGPGRQVTEDIQYNSFEIPKGSLVGLPVLPMQRVGIKV